MVLWMPYLQRPSHHLFRGRAVLDAAEPDFAEQLDARRGQLLEVLLDHLAFDHRRAGVHLHAAGAQRPERALREDRHRLEADHVARAAGHVDLARGNHGGDAAVQKAVDPADLVLPRGPVAGDGMHMAVDQAGRHGGAHGVDDGGGALGVDVLGAADRGDPAVHGDDGIGVQDRLFQRPRQQQADIADHQFCGAGGLGGVVSHGFSFFVQCLRGAAGAILPAP